MNFIIENIRLKELVAIVEENEKYYQDLLFFLKDKNYKHLKDFIFEKNEELAEKVIYDYLEYHSEADLYNGIFKAFPEKKARWYFISWILRDAPAQRLQAILKSIEGNNLIERKAKLLNILRQNCQKLFPKKEQWEWVALSEVLINRLEGSRRALKGNLLENIVREELSFLFEENNVSLKIGDKELKINEETYDVQVFGLKKTILLPVKSRETMGGGHALLFTRDIFKSISVAQKANYECVPVIIAESWKANLEELNCPHLIYIPHNPNQLEIVKKELQKQLKTILAIFKKLN